MKFIDYYKVMGLQDNASDAEIKKTYRKLARKYHPDVSKEADAEKRFKEIGEAYNVLKDPEKRREYDQLKQYGGVQGREFNPPPGWHSSAGFDTSQFRQGTGDEHFSDFFEQIFGNRAYQASARQSARNEDHFTARGQDIHTHMSISVADAYAGTTLPVSLQLPVYQRDGSINTDTKTLQIKIPKGVTHGQSIRLRGQGGPALGNAPAGDLYIELSIRDDNEFHLDGRDVTTMLPLAPWEAALGATVDVTTLGGQVRLTIPANSKPGQKMRLKGRGLPGNPPGDHYVNLAIVLPQATTDEQKQLYARMSELWSFNPRQKAEV